MTIYCKNFRINRLYLPYLPFVGNQVSENIYHIFHFQRSALRIKEIRAGRCRLYLPGFERISHQIIGGYSILAIPTLPLTIGGYSICYTHAITNHRRRRGYGILPYPPKQKKVSKVV